MTRPWIIWVTAIACVCIVLGAVAAVTGITLSLEEDMFVERERNERVAEASDLMEDYVVALLARENGRNAEDFSPVQTRFFNSVVGDSKEISMGNGLSPLFGETPEGVKYYWFTELDSKLPKKQVASPQLPAYGVLGELTTGREAKGNWKDNNEVHERLINLLRDSSEWSKEQFKKEGAEKFGESNLGQVAYFAVCASAHFDQSQTVSNESITEELAQVISEEQTAWDLSSQQANRVTEATRKLKQATFANSYSKAGKVRSQEGQVNNYHVDQQFGRYTQQEVPDQQLANPYLGVFEGADVSPFTALWVHGELMMVRSVITESGKFVQGVWLDSEKIQEDLLMLAAPFLPNAGLKVITDTIDLSTLSYGDGSGLRLSRLPFEIIPGEIPIEFGGVTPMRLNLIIAWACVLLALMAVSIMFRGVMKLSERRASFVSSVSHELRTPLTTFKLYSEMLADGMVKDPIKKQEYLETLTRESDRLTHMVENVLSFSQIERGKSQREVCNTKIGDLIIQLEPNIRMRLTEEDMTWSNELSKDLYAAKVCVEATSLDQIINNLVDNAAKYGKNKEGRGSVTLTGEKQGKYLCLRISDEGKGVEKSQEKRLFKAFHKSDVEAAHTKPGVGLGLALCRSLARSMGGDLSLHHYSKATGACFELKLLLG